MGYAIAQAAARRGAEVTLVSGPVNLKAPLGVNLVPVTSAGEMFQAVTEASSSQDVIIKAAAVADYRPASVSDEKMKKSDDSLSIPLERTKDILKHLGEHKKEHQFLCGFSMETEHMLENSRAKLEKKHLDMIIANLKVSGAGFGTDTNVITMITKEEEIALDIMTKAEAAERILDKILSVKKH